MLSPSDRIICIDVIKRKAIHINELSNIKDHFIFYSISIRNN